MTNNTARKEEILAAIINEAIIVAEAEGVLVQLDQLATARKNLREAGVFARTEQPTILEAGRAYGAFLRSFV